MKRQIEFYRCNKCGNIVEVIQNGGGSLSCCGEKMEKLVANTTDGAQEKHVPYVTRKDGKIYVQVGEVEHPMTEAHSIQWIALVSEAGIEKVNLSPNEKPVAVFEDRENVEVYEYCNLHGLWKVEA